MIDLKSRLNEADPSVARERTIVKSGCIDQIRRKSSSQKGN
ncbi:MAG TPA: hypothetical protein VF226_17240 [Hyphomicrobiaceae bacterium]